MGVGGIDGLYEVLAPGEKSKVLMTAKCSKYDPQTDEEGICQVDGSEVSRFGKCNDPSTCKYGGKK